MAASVSILYLAMVLIGYCSSRCGDAITAIVDQSNHTVQVSGGVEDDGTLTLHCNISNGELLHGQQLVWSEGGVEIEDSLYPHYQVTTTGTGSVLTFPNASDYRYGEYTCRCHNRFNYTVETIEAFIHNTSNTFSPYCSRPASTVIYPQEDNSSINGSWVIYHEVHQQGEATNISCSSNDAVLHLVQSDDTALIWEEPVYTVNSPANQAKFVCVEEEEVVQVHYVLIKGFLPVEFLIPQSDSDQVVIKSKQDSVLCAAISPGNISLTVSLNIQFLNYPQVASGISYGYLHVVYGTVDVADQSYICKAITTWEETTIVYQMTARPTPDTLNTSHSSPVIIAMLAYVLPSNMVAVGDSAALRCRVLGNSANYRHQVKVSIQYKNSVYDVELVEDSKILHTTEYELVVDDIEEAGVMEYTCIGEISEFCIRETDTTYLNVTSDDDSDYDYEFPENVLSSLEPSTPTSTSSGHIISTSNIIGHHTISTRRVVTSTIVTSASVSNSDMGGSANANPVTIATSIVFAVVLAIFIVIAGLMLLLCAYRWNRRKHNLLRSGQLHHDHTFDASDFDSVSISISSSSFPSLLLSPSLPSKTTTKFIQELTVSRWHIPYSQLQVNEVLGSGAFGIVRKATWKQEKNVAVKMLKAYATEEEQRDIITEFNMLQRVGTHKNIVNLIGASSHKGRLAVIVEYCSGGNLLNYLRRSRSGATSLSLNHQLNMALQVAEGMEYLASQKCVHRDLATRNVLITEEGTLKVADFGLARETYHSVYAKSSKGKIPFKWMAPESIFDNIYTAKSDVWSFGVLLWEISTQGLSPYPGKTVPQLLADVRGQKVMEKHDKCSDEFYNLMLQCWKYDSNERPSFSQLVEVIRSQTTGIENCVCEISDKIVDIQSDETDTQSLPSVESICTPTKSHHKVEILSISSAAETVVADKPDYYRSSSCMSDSSGGYLHFEEEDPIKRNSSNQEGCHSNVRVYKTRNGSCSVTIVKTDNSDDSGIGLEPKKVQSHHHILCNSTNTVEGIV